VGLYAENLGDQRRGENVERPAFGDESPAVEDCDAVGVAGRVIQIVQSGQPRSARRRRRAPSNRCRQ
jgi:hypothetical protein